MINYILEWLRFEKAIKKKKIVDKEKRRIKNKALTKKLDAECSIRTGVIRVSTSFCSSCGFGLSWCRCNTCICCGREKENCKRL